MNEKMGIKYFLKKCYKIFILVLFGCDTVVVISIHFMSRSAHLCFFLMKITLPPDILKLIELFANFILDSKLFDYLLVISQLPGSRALPATPAQL